jgi:NAD-dependent deacetylase
MACRKQYSLDDLEQTGVPKCGQCGGTIKPDVVLYEEPLNEKDLMKAVTVTADADVLLVIGTSLAVYPAAGLLNYYRGNKLIIVNMSPTPYDGRARILIRDKAGKTMISILSILKNMSD